jgi:predicted HAD superfamily Cof-like phosphohydrolase
MQSKCTQSLIEWHKKFEVPILSKPQYPGFERAALRVELIREEFEEFKVASLAGDVIEAADALGDLLYVIYGASLEWGIPLDAVFDEVHRSNMTKVWPDGTVHRREDGKILKPEAYSPVDLRRVLDADECYCHADSDGDCTWEHCPQLKDGEPQATGRSCPLNGKESK